VTVARDRGELAILLHSHMPYVEGFGTWPFGEEWLFEAAATAYLPLLERCQRWADAGAQDLLTVGVTPVLADQLVLPEVGERLLRFLRETRADCHRLDTEGLERAGDSRAADALRQSARDYERAAERFEQLGRDLVGVLRRLREVGAIELWASAASHAVLPLLATEAGIRLQAQTGIDSHRLRFGHWSGGFWLPECAFTPGIDEQLAQAGVRSFCVDQTDVGDPLDQLEPAATEGGAVAIPIDWQTISLVWDDRGYPADPAYRDYHAPTINGLRAWANSGEAYDAAKAERQARSHARHFVRHVIRRLDRYRDARGRPGLVVCALDTELLGHWWYEGPLWLDAVLEESARSDLALTTLPGALERHEPRGRALRESSWGVGKDLKTWDSPEVAGLVWLARRAEVALAAALEPRVLAASVNGAPARAARELLALQSSDWAFMTTRKIAGDYPGRRVLGHAAAFDQALASVRRSVKDSRGMREGSSEGHDAIDPNLRGLAPALSLSPLLGPSSTLGRTERENARWSPQRSAAP
jgi:1,4-alpha-glucan branching enzyme